MNYSTITPSHMLINAHMHIHMTGHMDVTRECIVAACLLTLTLALTVVKLPVIFYHTLGVPSTILSITIIVGKYPATSSCQGDDIHECRFFYWCFEGLQVFLGEGPPHHMWLPGIFLIVIFCWAFPH